MQALTILAREFGAKWQGQVLAPRAQAAEWEELWRLCRYVIVIFGHKLHLRPKAIYVAIMARFRVLMGYEGMKICRRS